MEGQNINTATGSASSNSNNKKLKQPLTTANKARLLKSTDSNKRSDLNDLKNRLLDTLENNKNKIQNRALISLQKNIQKAVRPVKLKNLKLDYLDKLDRAKENKQKLTLTKIKALNYDKTYLVNVIFYTSNNPNQVDKQTGLVSNKIKPAFYDKINENEKGSPYWMTDISDGVRQYTINTPESFEILELVKRKIFKYNIHLNHGKNFRHGERGLLDLNPLYDKMISYFDTDYEFMGWYNFIADYLHAFQIMSVVELSNEEQAYEPLEANLRDVSKKSIANKYIETILDTSKDTFYEAIQLGNVKHHDNECIINAFIDHYEYTLMKDNKRDILTRHKIIMMMGKTEKNFIKQGASIKDLQPIFVKYRLKVRIFDAFVKHIIYKYDPPFPDSHAKPFYCMIKNNHIYVLNYDLKSLEQKLSDEGDKKRAYASEEFYIKQEKNEDDVHCKMINNLEDVFKIVKDHGKVKKGDEPIYNLVLRNDDLNNFLFSLEDRGYEPAISHVCCKITSIRINFNKIKFIIKTQRLIKNGLDGSICVDDEETYNKMNKANNTIREQLFKFEHLSHYNKIDIDILDECRSIPPSGVLLSIADNANFVEIDISKAYTSELKKIKRIPIFNTFDKWMEYNNLEIEDYTLYRVSSTKTNMILNKKYNLLYGLILKQLNLKDFKILNYKKPSFVVDCDYSTIVNNLWNTEITDDVNIDKSIKKIINNVAIGCLEKGSNRAQSSCIFHTLEEARGYQTLNGGTINIITKQDESTTVEIVDKYPTNRKEDKTENKIDVIEEYRECGCDITIKRIHGPKRIKYEKQKIIDEIITCNITCKYEKIEDEYYNLCNEIRQQERLLYGDQYKEKSENEKYQEQQKYYKLHILDYDKYKDECACAENDFDIKYNAKIFNDIIWDDTFEITKTFKIESKGIKELYILNDVDTKRLKNGFRYIKELLLQSHNLRMYLNHQTLINNNINVYSVKTDAFTVDADKIELVKSLLKFDNNMGSWRVSNTDDIAYPKQKLIKKLNIKIKIPKYEINILDVKDEYDRVAICQLLEEHKQVMIKANTPGCGKSYICEGMVDLGYNVIFICPTNKLVQKYEAANNKITSVTINKFFNIKMGDVKLKSFDYSEFNVFIFDEIYCNDVHIINRIKNFIDTNKDKIIIATGDSEQLKPVNEITNQDINYDEYMDAVMSQLFKHEIFLKINKRFKNKEDMERLEEIKILLKSDCNINDLILKYFKYTDHINESENNIAYLNETCKNVSSAIRKKLNKVDDYEIGEILICRKYIKLKKSHVKFQVNFQYKIVKIEGEFFSLENIITGDVQSIGDKIIKDAFIFNYCATCHSSQGASINGKVCIFDYKNKLANWRWLWTAITRATEIENVYFYRYNNDKADDFNNNLLCSYFDKKIVGYKMQDKLGHREICKDYISSDWFFDNLGATCNICKCELIYNIHASGAVSSNITADRINNNIGHSLSNCKICCVRCNASKSNFNRFGKREIKKDNIEFID